MSHIEENIAAIRARIAAAARRAGRDAGEVLLIAVSKTFGAGAIDEAVRSGITDIGENRVQEFREKVPALTTKPRKHLIGHLQSNKANDAARLFGVVQSVDSIELAKKLDRAAAREAKTLDVMIQVNVGGEEQKSGCDPEELSALVGEVAPLAHLRLIGLMTVPPQTSEAELRKLFTRMRAFRDDARSQCPTAHELSMGMSEDFEIAIEEGATMIRIGRAIFGARG